MNHAEEGPQRDEGAKPESRPGRARNGRGGKRRAARTRQQIVRRRILILALICAALLALFAVAKNWIRPPELIPPPQNETEQEDPQKENESEQPQAATGRKNGWYTFLICGVDDNNGGGDTIIVAAFDTVNKKINMVSIPRDTMINVSWTTKKINSAYNAGGIERLKQEVSKLIGFTVDYYIKVDLKGFVELVDAIDGVKFDVPFDMNYDDPTQDLHIHVKKGLQTLDGEDAIGVVRWRKNNNGTGYSAGDIGRIGTQQAFLKELAKQTLTLGNLTKVPEFASIFNKYVETDLTMGNLVWLGQKAMAAGGENMQFFTMPGDYSASYYSMKYHYYVSYVTLDIDAVIALVNSDFNPYTTPIKASMLDIMTLKKDGSMASSRGVLQDPSAAKAPVIPSSATTKPTEEEPPRETEEPGGTQTPAGSGTSSGGTTTGGTQTGTPDGGSNPSDTGGGVTGNADGTGGTGSTGTAPATEPPSIPFD